MKQTSFSSSYGDAFFCRSMGLIPAIILIAAASLLWLDVVCVNGQQFVLREPQESEGYFADQCLLDGITGSLQCWYVSSHNTLDGLSVGRLTLVCRCCVDGKGEGV
jgi:hypothetical protein